MFVAGKVTERSLVHLAQSSPVSFAIELIDTAIPLAEELKWLKELIQVAPVKSRKVVYNHSVQYPGDHLSVSIRDSTSTMPALTNSDNNHATSGESPPAANEGQALLSKRGGGHGGEVKNGEMSSLTASLVTDDKSEVEHLKFKLKLAWAERENVDLEVKVGRIENENRILRARVEGLEDAAQNSIRTEAETEELQQELDQLYSDIGEKSLELAMIKTSLKNAEEAERMQTSRDKELRSVRSENVSLRDQVQAITDELDTLKIRYDEVKTSNTKRLSEMLALMKENDQLQPHNINLKASNSGLIADNTKLGVKVDSLQLKVEVLTKEKRDNQQQIAQLTATNTKLNDKIESLVSKIDDLQAKNFRSQEEVKRSAGIQTEAAFFKAKNENLQLDLTEIRKELQETITNRDWHKSNHVQLLAERNARNAERAQDGTLAGRLRGEIGKLKQENTSLAYQINTLKKGIGYYITELDLADAGLRVFNCRHERISAIPDGENTTREKTAGFVANEFFRDWERDGEFLNEYMNARLTILKHHRAHERVNQGKGASSSRLLDQLRRVDYRRDVHVTYH
ncbi:hypothetical protein BU26DRAFT_564795 [Trematosphaeria pertusa]|uniref:Uncharacterized protein n=1 Tax=Trematosphaeria pertusa TaxID=390896 RepID=A0A6A6IGW1_9PLEO|nr:uncharacterized protein BU26DRAFT_564795 [Trematosphaeria pertusa]KAF2249122.1 hypothetical protein BU26DRAFT_564795 [Trematosphaeria pertusa]